MCTLAVGCDILLVVHDRVERGFQITLRSFSIAAGCCLQPCVALGCCYLQLLAHTPADSHHLSVRPDQEVKRCQRPWVYSKPDEVTGTLTHMKSSRHKFQTGILYYVGVWMPKIKDDAASQGSSNFLSKLSSSSSFCFDRIPRCIVVTGR